MAGPIEIWLIEQHVGYRSRCTEDSYLSRQYGYPGLAENAGKAHARMKHPNRTIIVVRK